MGYIGQRMSERAAEAYDSGERPLSQWSKADILDEIAAAYGTVAESDARKVSAKDLRQRFLKCAGWHHTGKFYSRTYFYSFDGEKPVEDLAEALAPSVKEKAKAEPEVRRWALVSYEQWGRKTTYGRPCKKRLVKVATWTQKGLVRSKASIYEGPDQPLLEKKLMSSITILRELSRKPGKRERVWGECKEEWEW